MRQAHSAWVWLAAGLALALTASPVAGQTPVPSDDEVNAIAKGLYCPVCENIPLDVCGTQACRQWREVIREKLAQGWTADQIRQYFADQYGMRVLDSPPAAGLNWLIYIVPPLAIAGGGYVLARTIRAWRRAPVPARPQPAAQDPYVAQLEEEVRRRS
jgi:cytochrome c-type biogenesis protein CcmH